MRSRHQLFSILTLALALFAQSVLNAQTSPSSQSTSSATTSSAKSSTPQPTCTNNGTYVNSKGQTVRRPENCSGPPQGATAQCRDGTYSFSSSRRGTCSHHGGVAKWL